MVSLIVAVWVDMIVVGDSIVATKVAVSVKIIVVGTIEDTTLVAMLIIAEVMVLIRAEALVSGRLLDVHFVHTVVVSVTSSVTTFPLTKAVI